MLEEFTKEELKEELRKREKAETIPPRPLDKHNFAALVVLCRKYMDDLYMQDSVNDKLEHYIFEAAMEAVYGPNVFENLINPKL